MVDISVIITVYNKAQFLPLTIQSLLQQTGDFTLEYIFVDDASSDDSITLIQEATHHLKEVKIIKNKENKGPTLRLNQGAKNASGTYLYFLDGDDIVPQHTLNTLYTLLRKEKADMIYGKYKQVGPHHDNLLNYPIDDHYNIQCSDRPLQLLMQGGFVRMGQLCKRSLFEEANGCDPRIFIQDESLPLRLATFAKRFIAIDRPVILVPSNAGELSSNKAQQHHDRFFAHYHLLKDHPNRVQEEAPTLFIKCLSSAWKYTRMHQSMPYLRKIFFCYLIAKCCKPKPIDSWLNNIAIMFLAAPNIRRMEEH